MQAWRIELIQLLILALALGAVFGFNVLAGTTLTSPQHLAIDLASPPDSPQDWGIQQWNPLKYRVLFRWIVQGTFSALFAPTDAVGFYWTFLFWSFIFFAGALLALHDYLRGLGYSPTTAFAGCLLFLASPPVMLAYKYPVFTREDPLAYCLITLGLIALCKQKAVWVAGISTLAAMTRETTLIIPLTYLLGARASWRNKIWVCLLPIAAIAGIVAWMGYEKYNPFDSSRYNLETPGQTLAFVFCAFGVLWLPFLIRLRERWHTRQFDHYAWQVLISTAPIVLVLVLGTYLALARAREIRIAFLLFPWVIPLALDWFRVNKARLRALAALPRYWVFAFSIFALLSCLIISLHLTNPELMKSYLGDFKNGYWLFIGTLHLWATLALLPLFLSRPRGDHLQRNISRNDLPRQVL